jgi:putative salt-induced outer membrane protein
MRTLNQCGGWGVLGAIGLRAGRQKQTNKTPAVKSTMKPSRLFLFIAAVTLFLGGALQSRSQDQAPVSEHKTNRWVSAASFGLTLTRGNSETFLVSLAASTLAKWDRDELGIGADITYGTTKDQDTGVTSRTTDSARGHVQYNRLFTERLYGYGRVDGLYDSIADITYRFTLSPGLGYYLIKKKTTDLAVEIGPAYIFEKLGDDESDFASLRVGEKFHQALSDRARIWETAEWLPRFEDFSNYIINAEVGIAADLTQKKNLSLSCVLQDTYNSVPAPGRKDNDLKFITSINYKF